MNLFFLLKYRNSSFYKNVMFRFGKQIKSEYYPESFNLMNNVKAKKSFEEKISILENQTRYFINKKKETKNTIPDGKMKKLLNELEKEDHEELNPNIINKLIFIYASLKLVPDQKTNQSILNYLEKQVNLFLI